MDRFYFICAVIGGAMFLLQFIFSLFAGGDAHDGHVETHAGGDVGHDSSLFTGILSFRAMVAGLTVFGLVGLIADAQKMQPWLGLLTAIASAFAAMFVVAALLRAMMHLHSEGTIQISNALGQPGTVYLTIPKNRGGLGKVTLVIQNRTVEYQAMTGGSELPTGTKVNVVKVIGADTVEVVSAIMQEQAS